MKKFFILLVLILTCSICYADNSFSDLENHWAKDVILKMCTNSVVSGYEDGTFKPSKEISIAEFIKMLVVEQDYKLDVTGNRWPDWYVNTAKKNGLILENEFQDYFEPITRAEACNIIGRYIGLDDVKKSSKSFTDLSKENKEVVLKLVNLGIINGYKDGTFKEENAVTRAEACKIIDASYEARIKLIEKREYKPTALNTNIGEPLSGDAISQNRYVIKNNRIYINDNGRYAKLNNATLNQDYVKDAQVIKLVNSLVDDNSYTALMYVPDKYIINSLNVCYGSRQGYVNNGNYIFQIRFYENGYYNAKADTGIDEFCEDASIKIDLFTMWDKHSEYDSELRASDKNINKLEKALKSLFGESVSKDLIKYIKEKMILVREIPNDDSKPKFYEVKKFGKYTFNIICMRDEQIQIYVKRLDK